MNDFGIVSLNLDENAEAYPTLANLGMTQIFSTLAFDFRRATGRFRTDSTTLTAVNICSVTDGIIYPQFDETEKTTKDRDVTLFKFPQVTTLSGVNDL